MDYIFDKEKIERLLKDFSLSTGFPVVLYDAHFRNTVSTGNPYPFCELLWNKKTPYSFCTDCDVRNLQAASAQGSTYFYTCHAGVMETITPVYYDGALIAFVQLGQFRDEAEKYASAEKVKAAAKSYGFDEEKLLERFFKLPIVSASRLQATLRILNELVTSFGEKGLVYADRSMLSVKIEQFVESHITEDMQVRDLCKEFFLSRNALYSLFKTQFKTPVKEYLLKKRMQYVEKILLTEPRAPISQVATRCGFSDYNYFIRAFKKTHDLTPLQFRKSTQNSRLQKIPERKD